MSVHPMIDAQLFTSSLQLFFLRKTLKIFKQQNNKQYGTLVNKRPAKLAVRVRERLKQVNTLATQTKEHEFVCIKVGEN